LTCLGSAGSIVNTTGNILTGSIVLSGTNFFAETGAILSASGTWSGNTASGSSLNFQFYNDPANQQGAQDTNDRPGNVLGVGGFLSGGDPAFSATGSLDSVLDPDFYSLTIVMSFTLVPNAVLSNLTFSETTTQNTTTPVPEPASMLLLGTALLGAGVRRWRQKRAERAGSTRSSQEGRHRAALAAYCQPSSLLPSTFR